MFQHRHELLIHVALDFLEGEVRRDAVLPPGHSVRLEGADHQAAGVLAVIGAAVVIAHHRQVVRQAVEFLGHRVIVFAGVQRHADASHAADFTPPQATAVDHEIGFDIALVGNHAGDAAVGLFNVGNTHALEAQRAASASALDESLGDVDRARGTVLRDPAGAE